MVDPRDLRSLRTANHRLAAVGRRWAAVAALAALGCLALGGRAWWQAAQAAALRRELGATRADVARAEAEAERAQAEATRSSNALTALTRTHENILLATEQAPSVGTRSWGRRFTVTKYLPRDPSYGRFNDGITSTGKRAAPESRIVAVDPALIPYGSWVWIENLGWYRAEDCGAAIKGFRLDVLTQTARDASEFGRQDRFVIVVPPTV